MKFNLFRSTIAALAVVASGGVASWAADVVPAAAPAIIFSGSSTEFSFPDAGSGSIAIDLVKTGNVSVTTDKSWLSAKFTDEGLTLYATANNECIDRSATVTVMNYGDKKLTFRVNQPNSSYNSLATPDIRKITPDRATDNDHQGASTVDLSIDGNLSTIYHSKWSGYSSQNPAILSYFFNSGANISFINYVTRQDGGTNGNFGQTEIYLRLTRSGEWVKMTDYDFGMKSGSFTVPIADQYKDQPIYGVQFKVITGSCDSGNGLNFASCAEMEFYSDKISESRLEDAKVFTDNLLTALKPEVTQERVDKMSDPFLRELASSMLAGQYSTEGRVFTSEPLETPEALADKWNTPGKYYDHYQGATGIYMGRGTYVVVVEGIPEHLNSLTMNVIGWTVEDRGTFANTFKTETFVLTNGINVINRTTNWDGLAYVTNFDDEGMANGTASDVNIHFVNAPVNGVLRATQSNEENARLLANARYTTIDLVGQKVHSVWEVSALKTYTSPNYIQYINILDLLIHWEHKLLGFYKYNAIPKNKTLAYVNYDYYMYQGYAGVTFKYDTQYRTCSINNILHNDDDLVWGLSHEWGHQHQMQPYFRWSAMAEVTNNLNSYYNIMHMGYYRSDKINQWPGARRTFLDDSTYGSGTTESEARKNMLDRAQYYTWNQEFYNLIMENKDARIPSVDKNPLRAVAHSEDGIGSALCPFIMLYNYATYNLGLNDFGPDMYEALRQTDNVEGSTIEKSSGLDKYELIAAAQNYNKNNALDRLAQLYPESCWVKNKYITKEHCGSYYENSAPFILNYIRKTSRLTGYNLFPYFEQWGFLRTVAQYYNDYAHTHILMTKAMYDEFEADMNALVKSGELKEMPVGMVNDISNTPDINVEGNLRYNTPEVSNEGPIDLSQY